MFHAVPPSMTPCDCTITAKGRNSSEECLLESVSGIFNHENYWAAGCAIICAIGLFLSYLNQKDAFGAD
jgi:hypothetical protein